MKTIIALGGGDFAEETSFKPLLSYILAQSAALEPKLCFLPTASGDARIDIERFYEFSKSFPCVPSHLSLFDPPETMETFLLSQDIIFVGGGNTKSMLALWREWGVDHILRKAYERGIILSGVSAGAICWFEQGVTDSIPSRISALRCLGFLPGSCCPHYAQSPQRQQMMPQAIAAKDLQSGYALDDFTALHFVERELKRAVSSVPEAQVRYISPHGPQLLKTHPLKI